jgi:hypothetical protein
MIKFTVISLATLGLVFALYCALTPAPIKQATPVKQSAPASAQSSTPSTTIRETNPYYEQRYNERVRSHTHCVPRKWYQQIDD